MLIYHYDVATGVFLSSSQADHSPLEPGAFLIPAFATDIAPPVAPEGQQAVFAAGAWTLEAIPIPVPQQIIDAPETLFGGPTVKEVFYGDQ